MTSYIWWRWLKSNTAERSRQANIGFLLLLLVPSIVVPFGAVFIERNGFIIHYDGVICLALLSAYGLAVGLRLRRSAKAPKLVKWAVPTTALLYGEASCLILSWVGKGLQLDIVLLLLTTVLSMLAVLFRPRLTPILIYLVVYISLVADAVVDFHLRIHFLHLSVTGELVLYYLFLPACWIGNVGAGILLLAKNNLVRTRLLSSLRYSVGLATVLLIILSAHL